MGYSYLTKWIMFKNYLLSGEIKNNLPKDWDDILLYASCFGIENDVLKKIEKSKWNENENNFEIFIKNDGIKILSDIFYKKRKRI